MNSPKPNWLLAVVGALGLVLLLAGCKGIQTKGEKEAREQTKAAARSYRDLVVWQNAIKLAKEVYILVGHFPRQETYALGDQIRRAARNFAISSKKSRCELKKNDSRGAKSSISSPAASACST